MKKYRVAFQNSVSEVIEVEAESVEEAVEVAYDEFDYPDVNVSNSFEMDGDWQVDTVYDDSDPLSRWDYNTVSDSLVEIKY